MRGAEHRSNDHQIFLEATLPHLDVVQRVARHLSGDAHAAEDLVQETYLRAYAGFAGHAGVNTRAWLVAICVNLARSGWRRRARRPIEDTSADLEAAAGAHDRGEDATAAAVERHAQRELVAVALAELPIEQRTAVVLMHLAGYSASEVADLIGCPRGTVLARAHRGKRRLAQLLQERGVDRGLL